MLLRLIRNVPLQGNSEGPDLAKNAAVRGTLYLIDYDLLSEQEVPRRLCPTLENSAFIIPPGRYRLTVTHSPKFKRDLPLVNNVPKESPFPALRAPFPLKGQGGASSSGGAHQGSSAHPSTASGGNQLPEQGTRSGIRFHAGSKPEHSKGCILLSRADEEQLTRLIQSEKLVLLEIRTANS